MLVLTLMDYKDDDFREIIMCKTWVYFINKYNPNTDILILYKNNFPNELREYCSIFSNISIDRIITDDFFDIHKSHGNRHVSQSMMMGCWKYIDDNKIGKHIFIESDAFTLANISDWWNIIETKPYIATRRVTYADKTTILYNTGIRSFDGSDFITYEKLKQQYIIDGNVIKLPIGEEGLINGYFNRIGYNAEYPEIDFRYNWMAASSDITVSESGELLVSTKKINTLPRGLYDYHNYVEGKNIKILHFYYIKPWNSKALSSVWDFMQNINKII